MTRDDCNNWHGMTRDDWGDLRQLGMTRDEWHD